MEDFLYRAGPWAATLALHNWPLLIYLPLILLVGARAYLRPGRRDLLLLYGLAILALTFEYQKHGSRVAVETARYLFDADLNLFMQAVSEFLLSDVAPIVGHALGLTIVAISVAWPRLGRHPHRVAPLTSSEVN